MIGGWSSQGMNDSLKNNKKLLRSKKTFWNQNKRVFAPFKGKLEIRKASKAELADLTAKITKDNKKQRKMEFILGLLFAGVMLALGFMYFQSVQNTYNSAKRAKFTSDKKEYLEFVLDGDQWLEKRNWYNALYQYRKAQELFPTKYDIAYRIAYAYSLRCEEDYNNCKEAKMELDKLLVKFPKRNQLLKLKERLDYEYQ